MLAGVDEDRRGPGGVGCAEMPRARAAVVRAAEVVWRKERRVVMRDQGSGIRVATHSAGAFGGGAIKRVQGRRKDVA